MSLLFPAWNAPASVRACSTTRLGGVSHAPWDALNLGGHVGDNPQHVAANRQRLAERAALPAEPVWLEQVHGTGVVQLPCTESLPRADASYSRERGMVCAVMTADCLPVLFCSADGQEVAAAHAGWRGLQQGVLEQTLAAFTAPASQIMAWLGPAIGPQAFEVGAEVRAAFVADDTQAALAFRPAGDKYFADLALLARQRLRALGISQITGGDCCTYLESARFFSYRRDGTTGRMASLIWLI